MPETKPGWKTSEFWLHFGAGVGVFALSSFPIQASGLPPIVQGVFSLAAPLAMAWLAKNYGDGRTELKKAQLVAAAQAGALAADGVRTDADAAKVLGG